jgi:acyl-coenzyme A synthetase/AMP-(fatty) acid ligase
MFELISLEKIGFVARKIERFKLPDAIHFCDAVPVGNTGKASRAAVRQFIVAETRKTIRR